MKTGSNRWFPALLGLVLMVAMVLPASAAPNTAGQQASPPVLDGQWLAFDGSSDPARPKMSLLSSDADGVDLEAILTGCTVEDIEVAGQTFARLYGEGYGHPARIGWPDLPVLRRDVEVPFGATIALEIVSAQYADIPLASLGLHPIYPLQPPVPKLPGALENQPLEIDETFYSSDSLYPAGPLALGEAYVVRGHRVQPVGVWPVAYNPSAGTLRIYSKVTFRLRLVGSDMARTQALAGRYASPAFESRLSQQVLNYNQGRPAVQFGPEAETGYLIITADAYHDAMLPFVTLKEGRGFDVTMTRLSDIPGGSSNADIQAYIEDAYSNWPIPPSYVLLVGDTNTIPAWIGDDANEVTDLYYATMDGPTDWHPDIGRGRFPVRSTEQTTIMVDKSVAYASFTGQEPWLKKAAFIATCDNYTVAEGTHNYVIDNYTEPNGYTGMFPNNPQPGGDKIYCITYGGSATNITNAANDGRWAIIYSGHGYTGGWGDGAVSYSQDDVRNLSDEGFFPFVGSHACVTGQFDVTEAYAETWVLQENKGALVFWGSADNSFWGEDDILERAMFDSLFAEVKGHADVTEMTYYGLAETEATYPGNARYYWESYNIMGDPAVRIFLEPDLPTFTMTVEPTYHEICSSGSVTSAIEISSILGYSEIVHLENGPLPPGVTATFNPVSAPAPFGSELTLDVTSGTAAGTHQIAITSTDDVSWTHDATIELLVSSGLPDAPGLLSPPDGAVGVSVTPDLSWTAVAEGESYYLEVATDDGFGTVVYSATVPGVNHTPVTPLDPNTLYYWRVRAENACGSGGYSDAYSFRTVDIVCQVFNSEDVPLPIPEGGGSSGTTHSILEVPTGGGIADVNVLDLAGTHTYMGDLDFYLDSPLGTQVHLMARACGTDENFDLNLDDEAPPGPWPCPPTGGGTYQPTEALSGFDGEDSTGTWTLTIVDNATYDIGTLQSWSLEICAEAPECVSPTISLLSDSPVELGQTMHFTAELTGGSAPLTYTWDFGGLGYGEGLNTATPVYTYSQIGDYTVVVTAENECGDDSDSAIVEVVCYQPDVGVTSDSPVELGQPVHLTAELAAGTPPLTYTWDLGGPGYGEGLDTATPVYTYSQIGDYTVVVTAENECGDDSDSAIVEVVCYQPDVGVTSDSPVELGQPVHLSADLAAGTLPVTYTWDFGGPGSGTGLESPAPVYTYSTPGDYTVVVTVENDCGEDTASTGVTVTPVCTPVIDVELDLLTPAPIYPGDDVALSADISPDDAAKPYTYTVDFGDGTAPVTTTSSSDPLMLTHSFATTGAFATKVSVWNCDMSEALSASKIMVVEEEPVETMYYIYLPLVVTSGAR